MWPAARHTRIQVSCAGGKSTGRLNRRTYFKYMIGIPKLRFGVLLGTNYPVWVTTLASVSIFISSISVIQFYVVIYMSTPFETQRDWIQVRVLQTNFLSYKIPGIDLRNLFLFRLFTLLSNSLSVISKNISIPISW